MKKKKIENRKERNEYLIISMIIQFSKNITNLMLGKMKVKKKEKTWKSIYQHTHLKW